MKRLILILGLLGQPVGAGVVSGNDVIDACEASGDVQKGFCVGYIIGAWEGIKIGGFRLAMPAFEGKSTAEIDTFVNQVIGVCMPSEVDNRQITAVYLAYLNENPSIRHNTARHLLIEAMSEAFPCE